MGIESAADRLTFLSADDFGVVATYEALSAPGVTTSVTGIFDAAHLAVDVSSGVPISTANPIFTCRTADLTAGGAQGDSFTIGGVEYLARDIQSDGTGMTVVELEKA